MNTIKNNTKMCRSEACKINDGCLPVIIDSKTLKCMEDIIAKCKKIFSKPLSDEQCEIFLDTVIEEQLAYNIDIADLENTLEQTASFLSMLDSRIYWNEHQDAF